MKQGRASVSGPLDRKTEPVSKAVNPAAVADLGKVNGMVQMYPGRGYTAPMRGETVHKCGSQGKNK